MFQKNPAADALQIFSFRAECLNDVEALKALLTRAGVMVDLNSKSDDDGLPDVEVELRAGASLEQLKSMLRTMLGGHVMLQTLRPIPLIENNLERDYNQS